MISVAGRFAGDQARRALKSGLNVMLFSDNVPLQTEIELKGTGSRERAVDDGPRLRHGDHQRCSSGVCQCGAGAVKSESVAASGTGMQEASCIISNAGGGISQAIGTGSHDVEQQVGGMMLIEALKALAEDETTQRDSADFQTSASGGAGAGRRHHQRNQESR